MKLECGCIIEEFPDGMRRRDYCNLHSKIKTWYEMIELDLRFMAQRLIPEVFKALKEMKDDLQ